MSSATEGGEVNGKRLAALALAALGVVYGDIGTSPLYAVKEVFAGNHPIPITEANVYGSLSLFFWALIVIVSVKYVVVIMRADNRGEGGIMALIALALREAHGKPMQMKAIGIIGILGAAMFYGDGMVTPAISVLSAVEGLEVVTPAFQPFVIPITLTVLFALFAVQSRGTGAVGTFFGPIVLVWFSVLALLGIRNIIDHPTIFRALNPVYGVEFLVANQSLALVAMGSIVLAVTGAEALYADMGHFGRKPIQRAWFALVLPSLLLNYFGQGALILANPEAAKNPFYLSAPGWALLPLVGLATIATIIASQAVISGAFSVTRQAMQLGFAPRMEVQHTSEKQAGQIYLPAVNWGLFVAVAILVLGFQSSNNLAAAYGIAVTGDMVITSLLACFVVARVWKWGWAKSMALFACFLAVELIFLFANILKIPYGGWFPLVAGFVVFVLMTTWQRGREMLNARLAGEQLELKPFLAALSCGMPQQVPGIAIYLNADPDSVPHALLHSLKHYKVLHEHQVLVSVRFFDVPYVPDIDRVEVHCLSDAFSQVIVQYGFKDEPDLPAALALCKTYGLEIDEDNVSYFLGRETLIPRIKSDMAFWREKLFIAMFRNASSATAFFKIPSNRVVELGTQVVL